MVLPVWRSHLAIPIHGHHVHPSHSCVEAPDTDQLHAVVLHLSHHIQHRYDDHHPQLSSQQILPHASLCPHLSSIRTLSVRHIPIQKTAHATVSVSGR